MSRKVILKVAAASAAVGASVCFQLPAMAQDASLMADAKTFGARDAVIKPDLSADGSHVIYVTPGPDRTSIAVVGNLETGQFSQVASASGDPDILRWCNFVSSTRSVCQITGSNIDNLVNVIGFSRLVSINNDGSDAKMLGQTDSFYDAHARQYDGNIIDWLAGTSGQVLMERTYIPEEGKLGTRLVRTKSGLAVDRLNASSLSRQTVEEPRQGAGSYMSDGLGHVRLLEVPDVTPVGYV